MIFLPSTMAMYSMFCMDVYNMHGLCIKSHLHQYE